MNRGNIVWGGGAMALGVLLCLAFFIFDSWILLGLWLYGLPVVFMGHAVLNDALGRRQQVSEARTSPVARQQPYPPDVKREVWTRDGGACALCGAKSDLRFGLITPGGTGSNVAHLRVVCGKCERSLTMST